MPIAKLTIDKTKVGGSLTNFPLLVSGTYKFLATVANGGSVTSASGFDITFHSTIGGAKLDHEIISYSATGQIIMFVKIPALDNVNNTIVYISYGNASITTSQENKTGVWDSNYKAVWHCEETTTTFADSTGQNNLTKPSANQPFSVPTKIGAGGLYAGNNSDYGEKVAPILATTANVLNMTISAWVTAHYGQVNATSTIYCERGGTNDIIKFEATLQAGAAGTIILTLRDDAGALYQLQGVNRKINDGAWHYVVATKAGSAISLYVDGLLDLSGTSTSGNTMTNTGLTSRIGSDASDSGTSWKGMIDEVRLSNTNRSANWILTEYNNQNSPNTFYSVSSIGEVSRVVNFSRIQSITI